MKTISTVGMSREDWLKERKNSIGGSDVAAILGLSPWKTPVDIWLDKTGRSEPQEETEAMRLGTELEDFVARRYTTETGRKVRRHNMMICDGVLSANIDRLVIPEGEAVAAVRGDVKTDCILECKTSSRDWDGAVPLYYQTQVQHYMGLLPMVEKADVACLFLNHKHFEVHRVNRDDDVINYIQEKAREFWAKYVMANEPPPPTNEADCRALWKRSNSGKQIESDDVVREKVELLRQAKLEYQGAKERAEILQGEICAFMKDGEILIDNGQPIITWKSAKDSTKVDWQAVAVALGASEELIKAHSKIVTGSRRFVLK